MNRAALGATLAGLFWTLTLGSAAASSRVHTAPSQVAADLALTNTVEPAGSASAPRIRRPAAVSASGNCQRWRRIVHKLGETFAAHAIRTAVLARECALAAEQHGGADNDTWEWPWNKDHALSDLPPLKRSVFGAWELRCQHLIVRERCAMVQQAWIAGARRSRLGPHLVTTHFVIDNIAGRETVLWRIFVRRAEANWFAMPAADAAETGARKLDAALGGALIAFKISHCTADGCMSEAPLQIGARAISRLGEGRPVGLLARPTLQEKIRAVISARGFREAFGELQRLRRLEVPSIAHRRPGIE